MWMHQQFAPWFGCSFNALFFPIIHASPLTRLWKFNRINLSVSIQLLLARAMIPLDVIWHIPGLTVSLITPIRSLQLNQFPSPDPTLLFSRIISHRMKAPTISGCKTLMPSSITKRCNFSYAIYHIRNKIRFMGLPSIGLLHVVS